MRTQREYSQGILDKKIEDFPYYIIRFLESHKGVLQPTTLLSYSSDIREFLYWIQREGYSNTTDIKDIKVSVLNDLFLDDVEDFRSYLMGKKLANTTVNRKLSALKSLFDYLNTTMIKKTRMPYIDRNVMTQVSLIAVENSDDTRIEYVQNNILVDEEIKNFRKFVAEDYGEKDEIKNNIRMLNRWKSNRERDTAIVSMLLGTGLRIAELADIDIDNIDTQSRKIMVSRKSGSKRSVSYSKAAAKDLINYLEIRNSRYKATKDDKALFLGIYKGNAQPLTKRAMQKLIEKYAVYFGKPQISAHKLRHTFATNHMKKVNSIPILQKILDHASPSTTMLYNNLFDTDIQESIDHADEE
ncbi:tyrosine recombinase XerS [Bacillaceae bacterium CLA-AA-H227]|uniref:Tyrosine recombinase XerS n=1 Tax=Robertmurraya yapensis (ex Hitch et al 2024) TaxID=3133160 RepID=A0ACC6SC07_9BACI